MAGFGVDFSPLGDLYNTYNQAKQQRQTQDWLQGQGLPGNLNLAQLALQQQQQTRQQANTDREFGLQRETLDLRKSTARAAENEPKLYDTFSQDGLPQKSTYNPTTKTFTPVGGAKAKELAPADKKALLEAEDEIPNVSGTIESLKLAKDLNSKTFTGVTAGLRGKIGTSNVPGTNLLVDRDAAVATAEWQKLMRPEAIQQMSATLKGATTDKELFEFVTTLADPSTPPEIRDRMLDRMIAKAEIKKKLSEDRVREIRGGTYFKPGGGGGSAQPPDGAIQALRANPQHRADFDAKYGAGWSARILGGQ